MRVAWFHRSPLIAAIDAADAVDLAAELGRTHHIDRYDASHAHAFPPRHHRHPYDVIVYELGDTPAHAFMWPYLFHYPGILALQSRTLAHARAEALFKARRSHHLRDERAIGGWNLLGAPILASTLVVTRDAAAASDLREMQPHADVRVVPIGTNAIPLPPSSGMPRFVVVDGRDDVAARAAARVRESGSTVTVARAGDELRQGDVLIALEWPPTGAPPVAALRGMASGLATIVFETEAVAPWPALDPQTWQPRDYRPDGPAVAIAIDPRDEEHSLMLAMKRLSADRALAAQLGTAARAWAGVHANVRDAAAAWESVLQDAARRAPTDRAALPRHLTTDGTARAQALLEDMGVTVDVITGRP